MTPEGRAGLSISGFGKPIRVKPAPTNQLVPFVSSANPIGITKVLPGWVNESLSVIQKKKDSLIP
jgi:hypothetical protein